MQEILKIENGIARNDACQLQYPINLSINEGESVVIYGPNGGGKSLLVGLLTGAIPLKPFLKDGKAGLHVIKKEKGGIRSIIFNDVYGANPPAYYQQRWNHGDEMSFPRVKDVINTHDNESSTVHSKPNVYKEILENVKQALGISSIENKKVNQLSSGELRRFQLVRVLYDAPSVLIVDNPYIGLDTESRSNLTEVLEKLSKYITLVLVVCRPSDIPSFIKRRIYVEKRKVYENSQIREEAIEFEQDIFQNKVVIPSPLTHDYEDIKRGEEIVGFNNINLSYGTRPIFKNLCLHIKSGEHWALTGPNGAGKSTMLSLMLADNPIAYSLPIQLFGRKRGSGESIWDIKKRIGYVSPEIFSTYKKRLPVIQILASGLHDTIGIYHRPTASEISICREWLSAFGLSDIEEKSYLDLSHGEQRLVLLIRSFVKSPQLLILDEPFHGLDDFWCNKAKKIIDEYMKMDDRRTLVMVSHYMNELPACIDRFLKITKLNDILTNDKE